MRNAYAVSLCGSLILLTLAAGCNQGNALVTSSTPVAVRHFASTLAVTKYPLASVKSLCFNGRSWVVCYLTAAPHGITVGKDGALWFAQERYSCNTTFRPPQCTGAIGRITTGGTLTEYALNKTGAWGITAGPDGSLWFTEDVGKIGRITLAGTITEYATPSLNSSPTGITAGPDGALWFLESGVTPRVGRSTTAGQITEYPITTANSNPFTIASGSRALWFGEYGASKVGRISTAGKIAEFSTPSHVSGPYGIARGADGSMWFTELFVNKIGRITSGGAITEFPAGSVPSQITPGPGSQLWFSEGSTTSIGSISTLGAVTEYSLASGLYVTGIVN